MLSRDLSDGGEREGQKEQEKEEEEECSARDLPFNQGEKN